jgi:hypothetical protein
LGPPGVAGGGSPDSGGPVAVTGRERARGGPGATGVQFGGLDRAEARPAIAVGGAPGRRPREPLLRRVRDQSAATGGGGGSCAL